jgi:mitochondrial import receptor subunit TOM40
VTPRLALGGEAFWLGQQRKSGTGFAGRFMGDAFVATAQVATTGLVSLTYVQKISEKVRLGRLCLNLQGMHLDSPQSQHL